MTSALFWTLLALACGDEDGSATDSGAGHHGTDSVDCSAPEDPEGSPFDFEGQATCGAELYTATCTGCHLEDGTGTDEATDLTVHVPAHTDEELVFVIIAGSGDMPPQDLEPWQTAHVLAWLRHSFGGFDGEGH